MSPAYTVIQIQESANDATVVSKLRYPDGSDWLMIALVEIRTVSCIAEDVLLRTVVRRTGVARALGTGLSPRSRPLFHKLGLSPPQRDR